MSSEVFASKLKNSNSGRIPEMIFSTAEMLKLTKLFILRVVMKTPSGFDWKP